MSHTVGLRELKNARTREAIERAAAELALEQGFDKTTVDQIAERAEVAPRTVYVRYPTKEAILFGESDGEVSFHEWINGTDGDLVERLGGFVQSRLAATQGDVCMRRLKMRAIWRDPYLRRIMRGKLDLAEEAIAQQVARELGVDADDSGARVFAAGMTGLFVTMAEKGMDHPDDFNPIEDCAHGLAFLRAGLDALKRA